LRGKEEAPEALFEEGQEHFWKTVIDTMMDGLLVVDVEGVILSVNQAMEHITGYTREELVGQPCTILKCHTCLDSVMLGQKKSASSSGEGLSGGASASWRGRTARPCRSSRTPPS
jgi:PAS domain-containing protein